MEGRKRKTERDQRGGREQAEQKTREVGNQKGRRGKELGIRGGLCH